MNILSMWRLHLWRCSYLLLYLCTIAYGHGMRWGRLHVLSYHFPGKSEIFGNGEWRAGLPNT